MSEFSQWTFDVLNDMAFPKLHLFYLEALRQRASKAKLLAELLLQPHQEEKHQREVSKLVKDMLNPYNVKATGPQRDDWDLLRSRKR